MYFVVWRTHAAQNYWARYESEVELMAAVERLEANGCHVWIFNERDAINLTDL